MKRSISAFLLLLLSLYLLPAARGQQMGWQSARQFGGNDQQAGQPNHLYATAPDAAGNHYVVGSFVGATDFGGISLHSEGFQDGFVAKYDVTGAVQWVRLLSGPNYEYLGGLCVNPMGGCYVTGEFGPQATFDGLNRLSGSGIVTAAYDADGQLTWSDVTTQNGAATGSATAGSVALDAQGRCYVTGSIPALTRTFGPLTVSFPASASASPETFVCCYGRNRQLSWVKATTVTDTDSDPAGIVGTQNGCVVTSYYSGQAGSVLGVATDSTRFAYLASYYDKDGLVVALDSAGVPLWSSQIKNPRVTNGGTIWLAPPSVSGQRVLVAGAADTLTTFSQSSFSFTGAPFFMKTFVASYDVSTGALNRVDVLAQSIHAPGRTNGAAVPEVVREYPDGLYLGGYFRGLVQFEGLAPTASVSHYTPDGFVAKFASTGTSCEWVVTANTVPSGLTSAQTTVKGFTVLPNREVLVAGEFYQQATFGPTTLTAVGSGDLFLGRIGQVVGLADEPLAAAAGQVWPNPAREAAWLRSPFAGAGTATVFDALGRVVRTVAVGAEPVRLDCAGLPGGVYSVLFQASGRRATHRLVVQP